MDVASGVVVGDVNVCAGLHVDGAGEGGGGGSSSRKEVERRVTERECDFVVGDG